MIRKNIKISDKSHKNLTKYCKKNGLKVFYVIEKLVENCLGQENEDNKNK